MEKIGPYQILKVIGKGGMGEVFLAYDSLFQRHIALKRIRKDLKNYEMLKERFLKEAKITGQFTHPNIISVYFLHQDLEQIYYTMPYIEGSTLKQILKEATEKLHKNENLGQAYSIPTLMRIFFSICQAVSYAHSKGYLHRDLKPENILVGTYGEVIILDWGLSQLIYDKEDPKYSFSTEEADDSELTEPGKLVGTLAYMAPERAFRAKSNFQTDIYALGVILYQILTLELPFRRKNLKEFRKNAHLERIQNLEEVAPYRDVPPRLAQIVKKCLDPNISQRYQSMQEMLTDLTSFIEGRSDWFHITEIKIDHKDDWEFQENVLISRHIAITRTIEASDWASVMISKASFPHYIRIQTQVKIEENGGGIGFLISVPELNERKTPYDGCCLWLGAEDSTGTFLFRNTIQVMQFSDIILKKNKWHEILIEKVDHHINCYINGEQKISYISYLPLAGTHVGLLTQDANFTIKPLKIFIGNLHLQVSCLAIPDAFLAHNDYTKALTEYRRIAYSFPGHAEGREAQFRAGITLLEQAKNSSSHDQATQLYNQALEEFAKLRQTPGAPLEYLGKALIYETLKDFEEEVKCLELSLRRYHHHPLITVIKEQMLYRMYESSQRSRKNAFHLIYIALRHAPSIFETNETSRLLKHLVGHWETLPFIELNSDPLVLMNSPDLEEKKAGYQYLSIPLAFWLGFPHAIAEIYYQLWHMTKIDFSLIGNAIFSLIELGCHAFVEKLLREENKVIDQLSDEEKLEYMQLVKTLEPVFIVHNLSIQDAVSVFTHNHFKDLGTKELRVAIYLMNQAIKQNEHQLILKISDYLRLFPLSIEDAIIIDSFCIWFFLFEKNWKKAEEYFEKYPLEMLNQETTLLHPLFGCLLCATEGEEIAYIHFAGVTDTPYPRSWSLLAHQLTQNILESPNWMQNSFMWERRKLYLDLSLFFRCADQPEKEKFYLHLENQEYTYVE